MSDYFPESTEDNEDSESRGVTHFLTELAKLVNRYSYEYDMSYAEILGCFDISKQMVLDEMTELAIQAFMEDQEEKKKKKKKEEGDEESEIDYE